MLRFYYNICGVSFLSSFLPSKFFFKFLLGHHMKTLQEKISQLHKSKLENVSATCSVTTKLTKRLTIQFSVLQFTITIPTLLESLINCFKLPTIWMQLVIPA